MKIRFKTWIFSFITLLVLIMLLNNCKKDENNQSICMSRSWSSQNGYTDWVTKPNSNCNCIPCDVVETRNIVYDSYGQPVTYDQYKLENCEDRNKPPSIPILSSPANGSLITPSDVITWSCSDPDGDMLSYEVYFGTDNPPLLFTHSEQPTYTFNNLNKGSIYYCKIIAKDCIGNSTSGTLWTFNTERVIPVVTTSNAINITSHSAVINSNMTSNGGTTITAKGVCWSTNQHPTIADNKTSVDNGTDSFTSTLDGLAPNTTYYVRTYATNTIGTGYGNAISFKTLSAVPVVTTAAISSVTQFSSICGGTITYEGESPLTERGVCWSTGQVPTISDNKIVDNTSIATYISSITGLEGNTTYFVRAYASNSAGTGYGNTITFKTYQGTLTDIDGNDYYTVTIGTQDWMAQNLRTTKYNDGTAIPLVMDDLNWSELNSHGYCWYNNDPETYKASYGALYNWYVLDMANNGNKNVCPIGWRVPNDEAWTTLIDYLGGETVAGDKLKEAGAAHWLNDNAQVTNESGFTALPGGMRLVDNGSLSLFLDIRETGNLWSWTHFIAEDEATSIIIADWIMSYPFTDMRNGLSIRCLKN